MAALRKLHAPPGRLAILLAFGTVYLCWGATYSAMSIGTRLLPATVLAGARMGIAGMLMLVFCALRGRQLFYSRGTMGRLAALGVLILFGGNIGLVWSEKYLASGLAALLVAVVPLYVAVIESVLPGGERLRVRGILGLWLGFLALIALLWPSFRSAGAHSRPMELVATLVVLLGALSWAIGSVWFRRLGLDVDPLVAAGWEMIAAAICNVAIATTFWRWPQAHWNEKSEGAVGFLILFGSLLGFSCYIWLIRNVPVAKVATYAYVNPVIAVIIGALLLGEHLQPTEYAGMVAVIGSVALVTTSRTKSGRSVAEVGVGPLEREA